MNWTRLSLSLRFVRCETDSEWLMFSELAIRPWNSRLLHFSKVSSICCCLTHYGHLVQYGHKPKWVHWKKTCKVFTHGLCFVNSLRVWTISWPNLVWKIKLEVWPLRLQKRRIWKLEKRALVAFCQLWFEGQGHRTSRSKVFSNVHQKSMCPMVQIVFCCDVYPLCGTALNIFVPVLYRWAWGVFSTFCSPQLLWGLHLMDISPLRSVLVHSNYSLV